MPTDTNSSKPPVSFAPAPKKAFAFVAIPATDPSRCQAFYESVFGWTFWQAPGTPVTVFFTGGEVMGRISKAEKVITENHEDGSVGMRLFTHVDDVKETVEKIKKAGGKIVKDAWLEGEPAHTEMAFYKDTEGNVGGILRWITMGLQPKSPDA